ncbi:YcxB family protein [Kitasatospora cineracea]|uniref:YcxB-like protein n=1 Tax=Kitasatospora cineracea TaxID=88074 RepID=A0A8G1UEZ2_9ACTN|nr:YcxB family protein [Kitasatospora cineracea]ROR42702.1 YcxB-like protein [Kitasatospora cineracea]
MHITTSYQISYDDLRRGMVLAHRRRRRLVWVCAGILVVCAGLMEAGAAFGSEPWFYLFGLWPLTMAVLWAYRLTLGTNRSYRKAMPAFAGTTEVTLTPEAIRIHRDTNTAELAWSLFPKIEDTPDHLFLRQDKRTVTMILKRHLTAEQRAELADFVSSLSLVREAA